MIEPGDGLKRCGWGMGAELYMAYHDKEWGYPEHNDRKLFELLLLEGVQAGISWAIVLNKRENYRMAFDGFDPKIISGYDEKKIAELLLNPGIIRNRLKVRAAVKNANAFLAVQAEFGCFDRYIWGFVGGKPLVNHWNSMAEVPATTPLSDAVSKDLKQRGFTFVGSTICYSFLQACGLVNDHVVDCYRWKECQA
ncbi:MAG TPA: DNA-3-methyladenine glycosylase I [Longilinea sp.]|nr:DNA-3-methyladenine glycosylase I [Longilinea sp.]